MSIFDYAMEIERTGQEFYRNLASRATTAGVRTIYSMMAQDQAEILERFRAMKEATHASMDAPSALERAGNIFVEHLDEREALRITNDLDAYKFVMGMERDLCRLYETAAAREPNSEVGDLLHKIAEEERRELDRLIKVYEFVNAPNEYLAWGEFSNTDEFHNFGRYEDNRSCSHTAEPD